MTHCGGGQQACFNLYRQDHITINGLSITQINDVDSSHSFVSLGNNDGKYSNITVDKAPIGAYARGGRMIKLDASSYITVDNAVVKNGPVCPQAPNCSPSAGGLPGGNAGSGYNGIDLDYYSSHNTFNTCTVTNNGGDGIIIWGWGEKYNTFNNCTVSGNGLRQAEIQDTDDYNTISGGHYTGTSGNVVIYISTYYNTGNPPVNDYIHDATISGPGTDGILIYGNNGCFNNNTFVVGSGLTDAINVYSGTTGNIGSGNVLNNYSSKLTPGTCGGAAGPAPPSGLTATAH